MGWRVCSRPGCPNLHQGTGRCPACRTRADKQRRPKGNPYASAGHLAFRRDVLAANPRCVCPGDCGKHVGWCGAVSTVADHHPLERVELIDAGMDPDDPVHGRGVCVPCHSGKTARTRPGGWHAEP